MLRHLFLVLLLLHLSSNAQIKELSPAMLWKLSQYDNSDFPLFVVADEQGIDQMVKDGLGQVMGTVDSYTLIITNKTQLIEMVALGLFDYVGLDWDQGKPLNDQMILNNNIFPLHQGVSPLSGPLTGEGVIMGVVDSGVELDHPDFQEEDGNTRILKLWDQLFEYDEAHIPVTYGFGTEWLADEIDADIATHQDQGQWFGHGSTVTGTACGDAHQSGQCAVQCK